MNRPADLIAALHPLLDQALQLEPPARAAWLAELRTTQPELTAELERLLALETDLDERGFLSPGRPALAAADLAGLAGHRLGAYTLERPLGYGGMGSVWLARRSDGRFEGTAAVKLLNLGRLHPVGLERFRREGTLLARLHHPNIARLIDAGVAENGQPYLVLEYVEGMPIDRYAAAQRLGPEARIRLFLSVLRAVAHAHANLVVHRDLKPSNIVVEPDGTVKLLDFGIAKLLEEQGVAGSTTLTEEGGRALTPEYAAPEQVTGAPITTATDVYALGVLLYVLLSGRHPTAEGSTHAADHLRRVVETDPPRLSDAGAASAAAIGPPDRLRRLYAGDLDNIVAKALKKRPEERYTTVAGFAEDLRRYLAHEPVSARRDTFAYRAGKFVRRNRTPLAALALALLALVGAVVFSVNQMVRARRERDTAVYESRRADASSELQSILVSGRIGADGRALPLRDVMGQAEAMLNTRFAGEPRLISEILTALSVRLFEADDREAERELLDRAKAAARRAGAREAFATAACMRAYSFAIDRLVDSGQAELMPARQALGQRATGLALDPAAYCLSAEGKLLTVTGRPDSAAVALQRAIDYLAEGGDTLDTRYMQMLNDQAQALWLAERYRASVGVQRHAVDRLGRLGLDGTESMARGLTNLAESYWLLGEPAEASQVLASHVRIDEGSGRHVLPLLAGVYGKSHYKQGALDSAEYWLERALADSSAEGELVARRMGPILALTRLRRGADAAPWLDRALRPGGIAGRNAGPVQLELQARLAVRQHGPAAALRLVEQGLPGPDSVTVIWAPLLLFASDLAAQAHDTAAARQHAQAALRAGTVDSVAARRSELVKAASRRLAELESPAPRF